MGKFENRLKHPRNENRRLYDIYSGMKRRCTKVDSKYYHNYGGRGICVCEEWMETFDNFADWAYANGYRDDLTIDRINNDGNYEPGNCRWVGRKEQCRNKRNNLMITYNGETKCLMDWCDELDLSYDAMRNRIENLGWTPEKAFNQRIRHYDESISYDARVHGYDPRLVFDRINKLGWDYETAINTPVGAVDVTTDEYKAEHYGYAICPVCGEKFLKQNFKMKYCGRQCKYVVANERRRKARKMRDIA